MPWELPAIWTIVVTTIILFMRDERQLRYQRLQDRAQHFALAPAYRHLSVEVIASRPHPQPNLASVNEGRRRFMEALAR